MAAALCWLVYLAVGGQSMQQGQFVAFEAAGLMAEPPEAVTRVTVESADGKGNRWSTVGVSANIMDASFEALSDSICYKLYRDGAPA